MTTLIETILQEGITEKPKTKRARTAGTSANSKSQKTKSPEKKLKASITNQKQNKEKINNNIGDFNEIANEYASLDYWSRIHLLDVYEPNYCIHQIPENIQMVKKKLLKKKHLT